MSQLLSRLMRNFEASFGYPPGENRLLQAASERGHEAKEELSAVGAPGELIEFYSQIDAVSMPDVDNGFFIHSYRDVVEGLKGNQPTELIGAINDRIIVFGSDGGGGLFAISPASGQVYHLSGGSLIGSTYEADESGAMMMSAGLWEFLDYLYGELAGAIHEGWN